MPSHYLLDTVDNTGSSNSDSSESVRRLDKSSRNSPYNSQRTSLFEEFVDQT